MDETSLNTDFLAMFFNMSMFLESGANEAETIKSYHNSWVIDDEIIISRDIFTELQKHL